MLALAAQKKERDEQDQNDLKDETKSVKDDVYDDMCPYIPDLRHMDEKARDPTIPLPTPLTTS